MLLNRLLQHGRHCAAVLASTLFAASALAAFPDKPVTLIVGFNAGGQTDVQARALANAASKHLGQPIVVMNKPGMAATLGPAQMAANSPPDGYTLAVLPATLTRIPHMQSVKYDPRTDFTYILKATSYNFGVIVKADSPFQTIGQLLEHARANPGTMAYGASGVGGTPHIAIERMARIAGVKMNMIPFTGAAPIYQNILGGHITFAAEGGFGAMVDSGRMRVLSVFSKERLPGRPAVPTMREQKIDVVAESWWGIGGPKGMDPAVAAKLHDAFQKALKDPEFTRILTQNDQVITYLNGADFQASVVKEFADEERYVREFNLKGN